MRIEEKARAAALGYTEAINAKDVEALLDLFAEEGALYHPFGDFIGKGKLEEFYGGIVIHANTLLTPAHLVAEGNVAVLQVTGVSPEAPDQPQYALDLFEVNEAGKIETLSIYYRNMVG